MGLSFDREGIMAVHFLDLETTDLYADTGSILIACVSSNGGRIRTLRRDRYARWGDQRTEDRALVRELISFFAPGDVLVAYNGRRFDYPFLCTRALRDHLIVPQLIVVDPLLAVRRLRMSRRTLANVTQFLGLPPKHGLPIEYWRKAAVNGSRVAMNALARHCRRDVESLWALTWRLFKHLPAVDQKRLQGIRKP
jgi:uncharacterized protein YprB with RNaseH-like and TPR domain